MKFQISDELINKIIADCRRYDNYYKFLDPPIYKLIPKNLNKLAARDRMYGWWHNHLQDEPYFFKKGIEMHFRFAYGNINSVGLLLYNSGYKIYA